MNWDAKSKPLAFIILVLFILSMFSLTGNAGGENSEVVAIDNIIDEGYIGSPGVGTTIYIEEEKIFVCVPVVIDGDWRIRYMMYDVSRYESDVILEQRKEIPFDDSLSAVYTGEDILIFGCQLIEQRYDSDSVYRFNFENNKLIELDVKIPDVSSNKSFYYRRAVWAEDKAFLFLETGVYTFDPSDNSFERYEIEYPEDFLKGSADKSIVYVEGDIYIVSYDEIYRYDTDKNNLEKLRDLPTEHPDVPRRSSIYTGEYIYIIGGGELVQGGTLTDEIIRFDPETEESELLDTRLPQPIHACNLAHDGEYIYIFGGYKSFDPTDKHGDKVNVIYRYNYQGIDAPDDYPGPDHGDFPWSTVILAGMVGVIGIGGSVYYIKSRKKDRG